MLAARCGRVPLGAHDALLRSGRVFEYWAHEACLLPVRDEPYFRLQKRADGRYQRWFGPILKEHAKLADEVAYLSGAAATAVMATWCPISAIYRVGSHPRSPRPPSSTGS